MGGSLTQFSLPAKKRKHAKLNDGIIYENCEKLLIGDNQKILDSILLPGFSAKIKLAYLDPPYNTRVDKAYNDKADSAEWKEKLDSLIIKARQILREDGVLFISIDDNEYATLKILCDKIFGRQNFVGTFITRQAQRSNSKLINVIHEYVICYAREKKKLAPFSIKRMDLPEQREMILNLSSAVKNELANGVKAAENKLRKLISCYCAKYDITWLKNYNCVDEAGNIYFPSDLSVPGVPRKVEIPQINLVLEPLKTRAWSSGKKFHQLAQKGLLVFRNNRPYCKKYLKDARDNAPSLLNFYSRFGSRDLACLGLRDLFDTPKPTELIKFLLRIANVKTGDIVLDCFAGSATTGQAVLEVNREDNKGIGFMLIQQKEPVRNNSLSYKACLRYGIEPVISEIALLRLKKVYEKLQLPWTVEVIEYEQFF